MLVEHLSLTGPVAGCLDGLNADRHSSRVMDKMTSDRLLPAIGLDYTLFFFLQLYRGIIDIQKRHIFNVYHLVSLDICIHL